jgi:hypothetical protein
MLRKYGGKRLQAVPQSNASAEKEKMMAITAMHRESCTCIRVHAKRTGGA